MINYFVIYVVLLLDIRSHANIEVRNIVYHTILYYTIIIVNNV